MDGKNCEQIQDMLDLKPVNYEDINQVFSIAVEDILNNLESVFFKSNNKQYQINCEEIIVIISEKGRMLRVVTREEQPEKIKRDLESAGYSVSVRNYKSSEDAERELFRGFFCFIN